MNTLLVLKKLINFYNKSIDSEDDARQFKEYIVNDSIQNGTKPYLISSLTDGTGSYTTELAQHYLLKSDEVKGVTKIEQGLYWVYNYVMLEDFSNKNIYFSTYDFGFCLGMAWLFGKENLLNDISMRMEEYWLLNRTKINSYSLHSTFLYLLYKNTFANLDSYFKSNDNIYVKLLNNVNEPNDKIMHLLKDACDNHLLRTTIMGNKVDDIEFFWSALYPYEILCFLDFRKKNGFEIPFIDHELMNTSIAKANLNLSIYNFAKDDLLNKILKLLKR